MDFYLQILMFLAIFGAIILLAYYTTRFIGLRAGNMMKGKHIRIIDIVPLGTDKKLYLVKAGDKYLLLSSSGKNIKLVSEINGIIDDAGFESGYKGRYGKGKEFGINLERLKNMIYKKGETGDRGQDEDAGDF